MSVDNLVKEIEGLSYKDKAQLYTKCFGFGTIASSEMNEKLVLISLIALTSQKLKEKNLELTTLDLLVKITGEKERTHFYRFLENLSILVDDLSYCSTKFDPCGLKNSTEIINKIKELLNTWTPF